MKQVIQNFKTGKLYVDDLPVPSLSEGMVLVENRFSLISAGTERSTTKVGQASLIGKAKQRPDLVKQVLHNLRKEGFAATYEKVKTKLDSLKSLGYSTSGVVAATMDTGNLFQPGDRVACAGAGYASHADVVSVPQNLVVKIPDNVSFEDASFVTLGAIAMQGVRQADVKLGDNVCVIGLGLLGQLTCQLLKSNGCNVFGIDVNERMANLAAETNAVHRSLRATDANLTSSCETFTKGFGFDSVIITAAAPLNNEPIELASAILRRRGVVVVVGAVKMDIPREPHFYRKELELRMSCSYGPGRYDYTYEEKGRDYPYAYVRWTEQRNMEAFLGLVSNRSVDLQPLITHIYDIADAEKAYDLVTGKIQEPSIGILLRYNYDSSHEPKTIDVNSFEPKEQNVAFIGAGSFAQSYLIPNVKRSGSSLDVVITNTGINAKNVALKFGFNKAATDSEIAFDNKGINTIFIATRHDSHAKYVIKGLKGGKNIFVEKPLALALEELEEIRATHERTENARIMVGYNRRFSPSAVKIKSIFSSITAPKVITCRVNAGPIAIDSWIQDKKIGGGRIIGEMCHFIDLMQFFTDAVPVQVYAHSINDNNHTIPNEDNVGIIIKFSDGSLGNLIYVANGNQGLAKERIEVSGGGKSAVIEDFKRIIIYHGNKITSEALSGKGHSQEIHAFIEAIRKGRASPIAFTSLYYTTVTTFKIQEALSTGMPQKINI